MSGGKKFYRDTFNGKLLGVCAGFAEYFDWDVAIVRIGVIVVTLLGIGIGAGFFVFVIPAYFLIAMVTDKKPPHMFEDSLSRTFSDDTESARPASRKGTDQ